MALSDNDMLTGLVVLLVEQNNVVVNGAKEILNDVLPWAEFQGGSDTEPLYVIVPAMHALGIQGARAEVEPSNNRLRLKVDRRTPHPLEPTVVDNGQYSVHFYNTL